ncbi:MAG: DUF983 domain-containing protein [Sphingomonas sp.]|nr:DUF983 domain-containing protein [Sphingomonas sp.]
MRGALAPLDPLTSAPTPTQVALKGLCPRCGSRTLFKGWTQFADRCGVCGLDLSSFNVGDGPAAFLTLIIGAVIVALAITVELSFSPPFWVHIILWIPLTAIAVVGSLKMAKGALISLEYRNAAAEGRIKDQ